MRSAGKIKIGNNFIIGLIALINKNIPDNCVVGGNLARVIISICR